MTDTQPKLTDAEIDALKGEALHRALHECVHDWGEITIHWSDSDYAREVEAEIERRGLKHEYIISLCNQFTHDEQMWAVATATPEQRCRAALKAVTR